MPSDAARFGLVLDPEELRPLIAAVVAETLARIEETRAELPGSKLAYSETEAARLLSLNVHQLRDARLRGEIAASIGPGRRVLYSRDDLLNYLAGRRWKPASTPRVGRIGSRTS